MYLGEHQKANRAIDSYGVVEHAELGFVAIGDGHRGSKTTSWKDFGLINIDECELLTYQSLSHLPPRHSILLHLLIPRSNSSSLGSKD